MPEAAVPLPASTPAAGGRTLNFGNTPLQTQRVRVPGSQDSPLPPSQTPRRSSSATAQPSGFDSLASSPVSSLATSPTVPASARAAQSPPPAPAPDAVRAETQVAQAQEALGAALRWRALRDLSVGGDFQRDLFAQLEGYGHKSTQDLQALEDLVHWIRTGLTDGALAAQAPGGPTPDVQNRAAQVIRLSRVLQARLPEFTRQTETPRLSQVLGFLAQRNIDADRLDSAMGSARWRDGFRQLLTSEVGYMSSFGVFNGLMATLLHQLGGSEQRLSPAQASAPLFAAPLTAMGANWMLRQLEVPNQWTRTVEAGPDGKAVPHAQTTKGFAKVTTQYWGFVGSLGFAAWDMRGPLHRVLDRISGGFVATACVALHRLLTLHVDYPWLKAGTPLERRALLGALRQLAPSDADEPAYAPRSTSAAERLRAELPSHHRAKPWEEPGSSAKRILCFFIPLALTFTFFAPIMEDAGEALTPDAALRAGLAASAGAVVLLALWGPFMAAQERLASTDPTLVREMQARAARRQAALARSEPPEAPPQIAQPQDLAPRVEVRVHPAPDSGERKSRRSDESGE